MKNQILKILFTALLLCGVANFSDAQDGSPFITNYPVADETMSDNYSLCVDNEGVLVVANRKGLLVFFDKDDYNLVKTPELPLVVATDPTSGRVFIGCRNYAGYLNKNSKAEYEYVAIDVKEPGLINQILFSGNTAFFISPTCVFSFEIDKLKMGHLLKAQGNEIFNVGMILKNELLLDVETKGLCAFSGNSLKPVIKNFALSGKMVFAISDSLNVLIGTTDNKCYIFDGKQLKNIILQDQQYVSDGKISDGKKLGKSLVVVSTSNSGCLVFDQKTGKTVFTVNYQNGLPDDDVYAINTDKDGGIWLAHYYGLTRVDAGIPVKNFTHFRGVTGKYQALGYLNNKLFVGTNNGVYYLVPKKDYAEFTPKAPTTTNIPVVEPIAPEAVKPAALENTASSNEEMQKPKEKKGFLARIFGRKKNLEETPNKLEAKEEKSVKEEEKSSGFFSFLMGKNQEKEKPAEVKKTYRIASVRYEYAKVPGFESNCRKLILAGDKLIALSINGVYEITESRANQILASASINYIYYAEQEKKLYICTNEGIKVAAFAGQKWNVTAFAPEFSDAAYSFAKDVFDNYWIGGESKVYKIKLKPYKLKEYVFPNDYREPVKVRISDKKPIFFLSSGIYSIFNDSVQENRWLSNFAGTGSQIYFSNSDLTWIEKNNNWLLLKANGPVDSMNNQFLNLFGSLNEVIIDKNNDVWVIDDNSSVYKVDQKAVINIKAEFNAFVKRFTGASGESLELNNLELENSNNQLKVIVSAPYFLKPNSNQYQIFVKGLYKEWGSWTNNPEFPLVLPSGNWEVQVRAKNVFGNISAEKSLKFYIAGPFYTRWWFILLCIAALVYLVILIIQYRERALRQEKEILENKVRERTKQIEEQKEEIEAQRDDLMDKNVQITAQKEEIEAQRNKIALQNHEITDSIRYAKRLQSAVMPDEKEMTNLLKNHFVLFKPKDIVSGDFFWAKMKNGKVIVAAADCTGHGVPGGFLSMLGISFLNEISAIDKEFNANEILNILRNRVKSTLVKEGYEEQTRDGMDICLLIFDPKTRKAQFAGANNPLFLIRNNGIIEYTADKMPIGAYIEEKESFSMNEFEAEPGDTFYLFSDGFRDQIGGLDEKRIKTGGFKKLLLQVQDFPMAEQKEKLEHFFEEWKGKNEQMDDILVIGVRV